LNKENKKVKRAAQAKRNIKTQYFIVLPKKLIRIVILQELQFANAKKLQ